MNGSAAVAVKVESSGAVAAAAATTAVAQFDAVQEVVVQFKQICCWVSACGRGYVGWGPPARAAAHRLPGHGVIT